MIIKNKKIYTELRDQTLTIAEGKTPEDSIYVKLQKRQNSTTMTESRSQVIWVGEGGR